MSNNGLSSLIRKTKFGFSNKEKNTITTKLGFDVKKGDYLYKKDSGESLCKLNLVDHSKDEHEYFREQIESYGASEYLFFNDETNDAISFDNNFSGVNHIQPITKKSMISFLAFTGNILKSKAFLSTRKANICYTNKKNNEITFVSSITPSMGINHYSISTMDKDFQIISDIDTGVATRTGVFTAYEPIVNFDGTRGYIFAYSDASNNTKFKIYDSLYSQKIEVTVDTQAILDNTLTLIANEDDQVFLIGWIDNTTKFFKYGVYTFDGTVVSALKDLEATAILFPSRLKMKYSKYDRTFVVAGYDADLKNSRYYKIAKNGDFLQKITLFTTNKDTLNFEVDNNLGLVLATEGKQSFKLFNSDNICIKSEVLNFSDGFTFVRQDNFRCIISNFHEKTSEFLVRIVPANYRAKINYFKYNSEGILIDKCEPEYVMYYDYSSYNSTCSDILQYSKKTDDFITISLPTQSLHCMSLTVENKPNNSIFSQNADYGNTVLYKDKNTNVFYKLNKTDNKIQVLFSNDNCKSFSVLNEISSTTSFIQQFLSPADITTADFSYDFITDSENFYLIIGVDLVIKKVAKIYKFSKGNPFSQIFSNTLDPLVLQDKFGGFKFFVSQENKLYLHATRGGKRYNFVDHLVKNILSNLFLVDSNLNITKVYPDELRYVQSVNNFLYLITADDKVVEYNTLTDLYTIKFTITYENNLRGRQVVSKEGYLYYGDIDSITGKVLLKKVDLQGNLLVRKVLDIPTTNNTFYVIELLFDYENRLLSINHYDVYKKILDLDTLEEKINYYTFFAINYDDEFIQPTFEIDRAFPISASQWESGNTSLQIISSKNNILYNKIHKPPVTDRGAPEDFYSRKTNSIEYIEDENRYIHYSEFNSNRKIHSVKTSQLLTYDKFTSFSLDNPGSVSKYHNIFETDDFDATFGVSTFENNICNIGFAERDGTPIAKQQITNCDPIFVTGISKRNSSTIDIFYLDFATKHLKINTYSKLGVLNTTVTLIPENVAYFNVKVDYNTNSIIVLYKAADVVKLKKIDFAFNTLFEAMVDTTVDSLVSGFEVTYDSKIIVGYSKSTNTLFKVYTPNLDLVLFSETYPIFSEILISVSPNNDFFIGGFETSASMLKGKIYSETFTIKSTIQKPSASKRSNFSFNSKTGFYTIVYFSETVIFENFDTLNNSIKTYRIPEFRTSETKTKIFYNNDQIYLVMIRSSRFHVILKLNKNYELNTEHFIDPVSIGSSILQPSLHLIISKEESEINNPVVLHASQLGQTIGVCNYSFLYVSNSPVYHKYKKYAIAEEDAAEGTLVKLRLL